MGAIPEMEGVFEVVRFQFLLLIYVNLYYKKILLELKMRTYSAIIEKCKDTGLFVGYVPGFPGAHSQGETLEELRENLKEVIEMLLEDGEPSLDSEFIGTQNLVLE
jgi:predicted RNase H-like HicB family nuclease